MSDIPRHDGPTTMATSDAAWWERERAEFVRSRLAALTKPSDLVADIGCGRATMLDDPRLADRVCVNVDSHRWAEWSEQDRLFVVASADALPFRDGAFDVVGSFDVLEHLPADRPALQEQRRLVGNEGHVVTAVPADRRLWSAHDVAVGHYRRYSTNSLAEIGADVGLEVRACTYFFSYLWPPAWLTRKRSERPGASDPDERGTSVAAAVIGVLARAERALLRRWRLPFGTSLWLEFSPRRVGREVEAP